MKKILFVCTGNTCRSPMAEAITKHLIKQRQLSGVRCSSAGVYANVGDPISSGAKAALKQLGIKPVYTKAKQVSGELLKKYNLVLCMTQSQKDALSHLGHKNIYTIAEFASCQDISDPYGCTVEVYVNTANQIMNAASTVLDIIV